MQAFSLCVRRYIVWLIISMHLAISFPAFSESTHPDSSSTESPVVFEYSDTLTSVGLDLNSSVENAMKNRITNTGASTVQEWLNQFGTAEVHLNVDDNGNWDNSSLDYLQPLYDNKKSVLFTQLGMRAPNGRFTTNIGFGVRTFYLDDWMFGANFFFDHDFEGGNRRVGVGGEAWTDNFKLSANTYAGTTDWHNSRDFDGYYEKPADGFDVRMEAFLPSYPQLGGRMMYEKYYGNQVALFDKDHLQKNPSAVTVGLNYTPVPLITAGVDYRRGQNSLDETKFTLNFRYDLGRSWQEQTSSDQVALRRSLAGSRYDLVERNNEIILQYKKKETRAVLADMILSTIKDNSPADGIAANTVTLHAVTSDGSPVANASINWAVTGGAKLSEETGTTDSNGYASVNLTNTTAEHVTVTATSGSIVRTAPTSFSMSVASLDLVLTKNNSQADGIDQNAGQVTLKDASGKTLPGVAINWQVGDAATVVSSDNSTDSKGQATIHFTSTTAGSVKLTASANNKTESVNATFADQLVSNIAVTMTTDGSPADGSTPNKAQALVTSAGGQPMPNVSVTWTLSGSATAATATTLNTDDNGVATLSLTDSVAESVTVTASAGTKTGKTTATFSAVEVDNVAVTMTTDGSLADGSTPNKAQALVTSAGGQPMPNVSVTWTLSGSATAATATTLNTDDNGVATLSLTDSVAESVTVTARAGTKTGKTTATFSAVEVDNVAVTMTTDGSLADGSTPNKAQALVTSAGGQPMPNVSVTWTLSGSATAATATTLNTDDNGVATLSLTDSVAESVTVTARAGTKTGKTTATFTAVPVDNVAVTMTTDGSPADGSTPNVAQALVTSAGGQPMPNVSVTWTLSGSATAATATTLNTDDNGVATLSLTDSVAESVTVTASAGTKTGNTTATFSAVPVDNVAVTMTTDGSPADGSTPNVAQALVTSAGGQPMPNVSVTWTLSGSATAATATTLNTDDNGVATLSLTDSVAESVTVTARAGTKTGKTTATFSAVPVDNVAVTMTTDGSLADGSTPNKAQALVTSAGGQPMPNVSVTWTLSGSATAATATTLNTDDNGVATLSLTDSVAESVTVTARAGTKTGKTTATFTAVPVDNVAVTMTTDGSPADGSTPNVAQALVTSAGGQPMPNVSVTWTLSGSATAATATTLNTDDNGVATLSLTDSVAESVTVTASAGTKTGNTTATFSAVPVDNVAVTMTTDGSPADGSTPNKAQALVTSAGGQPMPNVSVTWTLSGSATAATATTLNTDDNGVATLSLTDSVAESVTVTASAGTKTGNTTATFTAVPVDNVAVTMTTDGSPADGSTPNVAQALVTSAGGQPMPNVSVTWTLSGSATAATATTLNTDDNGVATLSLTDSVAESVTVTASAGTKTGDTTASFAEVPLGKVTDVTLTATGRGSQSDPAVFVAHAVDALNRSVPDASLSWERTPNGNVQCNAGAQQTDANGNAKMICYTLNNSSALAFTVSVKMSSASSADPSNPPTDSVTKDLLN